MTRSEAYSLLVEYMNRPVFVVRVGICSPDAENVTFEDALNVMDNNARFTTEWQEYVHIEAANYVKDADRLDDALRLFNLGRGRCRLNQEGLYT